MIKVEESITINRSVGEVFAFVAEQANAPRWQSGILEVRRTTTDPLGVGTQYTFVRKLMDRRLEASNEYVEYEPNKKIVFKSTSGPMDFSAGYLIEPAEAGTNLTSWIEMQPQGFLGGLAEPLIASSLRRDVEANLSELKDLLEAPGSAPVAARSPSKSETRRQTMQDPVQHATPYSRRLGGESSYWSLGLLQTFLVEGRDTDGQVTLGEGLARKGTEPPPHTHTREDEAYYILEGELTFYVGGRTIAAQPGDFVWLPRGVEHSFALQTPQARALVMFSPAGLEEAFKRVGEPARSATLPPPADEPLDVQEVLTLFSAYGLQFGPPLIK